MDDASKQLYLKQRGLDSNQWDVNDDGYLVAKMQPTLGTPVISSVPPVNQPQTSALGAGASHAAQSLIPGGAGVLGGAGMASILAPQLLEGPGALIGIPLTLGAAGIASYLASKAQEKVLPDAANQYLQQSGAEHPIPSTLGSLAGNLPYFAVNPSGVPAAARSVQNLIKTPAYKLAGPELANLSNVAIGAGLPAGQAAYNYATTGEAPSPAQLAMEIAGGALMNNPRQNRFMEMAGMHSISDKDMQALRDRQNAAASGLVPAVRQTVEGSQPQMSAPTDNLPTMADRASQAVADRIGGEESATLPVDQRASTQLRREAVLKAQAEIEAKLEAEKKQALLDENDMASIGQQTRQLAQQQAATEPVGPIKINPEARTNIGTGADFADAQAAHEAQIAGIPFQKEADTTLPDNGTGMTKAAADIKAAQRQRDFELALKEKGDEEDRARELSIRQAQAETDKLKTENDARESQIAQTEATAQQATAPQYTPIGEEGASAKGIDKRQLQAEMQRNTVSTDEGRKFSKESPTSEELDQQLKNRGAGGITQNAWNAFKKFGAKMRNINLVSGRVVDQNGNPVSGETATREGTKEVVAKISPNANLRTIPHEFVHPLIEDLIKSPSKTDNQWAQAYHDKVAGSQDYKDWINNTDIGQKNKGLDGKMETINGGKYNQGVLEYIAHHGGADTIHMLSTEDPNGMASLMKGFVSHLKTRYLNNGTVADWRRLMVNKLLHDVPYHEGVGSGIKPAINASGLNMKDEGASSKKSLEEPNTKDIVTSTEKELAKEKPFGLQFGKEGSINAQNLKSRLESTMPKGEVQMLKDAGLDEYLKGKPYVNKDELKKWIQENGPKVEVRKFGDGYLGEATKEYRKMTHEWYDNQPDVVKNAIDEQQPVHEIRKLAAEYGYESKLGGQEFNDQYNKYLELQDKSIEEENNSNQSKAKWKDSGVTPKSPEDMPGYSEIAVVKPLSEGNKLSYESYLKQTASRDNEFSRLAYQADVKGKSDKDFEPQFQSSHSFPPNTLVFNRGYTEHGKFYDPKTGKLSDVQTDRHTLPAKIWHGIEFQSDWAAQKKRFEDEQSKANPATARQIGFDINKINDPRLEHYNNLGIKAAIQHALETGHTHLAISDAETAMMTEGHDRHLYIMNPDGTRLGPNHDTPQLRKLIEENNGEYKGYTISNPYEKGMRQAYDNTLPNIASKLTGYEGEKMSFGEHKNAFQPSNRNQAEGYGREEAMRMGKEPRKDLIFKNPGTDTPKTDVSARVYPLDKVAERLKQEPFSQQGKFSSETPSKDLSFYPTEPLLDKAEKADPKSQPLLDQVKRYYPTAEQYEAKYAVPAQDALAKLPRDEQNLVGQALLKEDHTGISQRDTLTEKQQEVYDELRANHKQMRLDQIAKNQPVWHGDKPLTGKVDELSWPNRPDPKAIDKILEDPNGKEATQYHEDFVNHVVEKDKTGLTKEEKTAKAEKAWEGFRESMLAGGKGDQTQFNAVRKSTGIGLPDSMIRKNNFANDYMGYISRFAKDRAYHDTIESDPVANQMAGAKQDPWGKDYAAPLKGYQRSQIVDDVMKHVKGEHFDKEEQGIKTFNRAATAGMLGVVTNQHILLSSTATAAHYLGPKELINATVDTLSHLDKYYQDAVRNGAHKRDFTEPRDMLNNDLTTMEKINTGIKLYGGYLSLGKITNAVTKTVLQGMGHNIIDIKQQAAMAGDQNAIKFLKKLDPKYDPSQPLSEETHSQLASQMGNMIHGHNTPLNQPNALLKDNVVQPFAQLMSWNIAQTNHFFKHVLTPAKEGNLTPLLMSTVGAIVGGSAIKNLREELAQKEGPIPNWKELEMSSKGIEGNGKLVAYKLMDAARFTGYMGILSQGAKSIMDMAAKNQPTGATFPLDELISNTATEVSQITQALATEPASHWPSIIMRAAVVGAKSNVQNARIALNFMANNGMGAEADQYQNQLAKEHRNERVYKMSEGLPYQSQSPSTTNPLVDQDVKEFQRTQDMPRAVELLRPLIDRAIEKAQGNPDVLRAELSRLKGEHYDSYPSPESEPIMFSNYLNYRRKVDPEAADSSLRDFFQRRAYNQAKSGMVPSF